MVSKQNNSPIVYKPVQRTPNAVTRRKNGRANVCIWVVVRLIRILIHVKIGMRVAFFHQTVVIARNHGDGILIKLFLNHHELRQNPHCS